jgi:hypothetical protein
MLCHSCLRLLHCTKQGNSKLSPVVPVSTAAAVVAPTLVKSSIRNAVNNANSVHVALKVDGENASTTKGVTSATGVAVAVVMPVSVVQGVSVKDDTKETLVAGTNISPLRYV